MPRTLLAGVVAVTGVLLAATACGNNSVGAGQSPSAPSGHGGARVGVILPETATSARYAAYDQPMLQRALQQAGLDPIIENAQGDAQKFSQIADTMLSQQVKVLIVDAPSTEAGAAVEQKAKQQGVPVIDYDRLDIGGSSDYYVTFDNEKIGQLQAQALATALKGKPGSQVIEIEGSPTDNNATLVHNGQQRVVKPLYDAGTLKLVNSRFIDAWDNQAAGQVFEQLLTANGGHVDGVLVANDGMAGAVITVLQKYGLAGKVPVTGQDAGAESLKAILQGDQYSTVFKPIQQEADATAKLAAALAKGDTTGANATATQVVHDPKGNRDVKSVLLDPQAVTKDNVKIPVSQGYVQASEICGGNLTAVCQQLGISGS